EQAMRGPEPGGAADDREQRRADRGDCRQPQPSAAVSRHQRASARRRRRSRSGRALVTYGIRSKLCSGGGDVVYHSSVSASHGSLAARAPTRAVFTTFQRKTSIPIVITPEPIVESRLYAWVRPCSL